MIGSALGKAGAWVNRFPGIFALADQGVVSVANFATGLIVGRVCGREELGVYALAYTLMTLAIEMSSTLTTTPYTVFSPQLSRDQRVRYLGSILVHQTLLLIIFSFTFTAISVLGSRWGWLSQGLSRVIITAACAVVFVGLREFVRRVSFAELNVGSALLIDVIACLTQGAGALLLLHFDALTAARMYALLGTASGLVAGSWLALHRAEFRVDAQRFAQDIKRNWGLAKWVLGSSVLWTSTLYVYPWLLAAFHGTSATGTWAACSSIVALGNPVVLGLSNYVGPKIHNTYAISGAAEMQRCINRYSLVSMAVVLPLVLVLVGAGERIVIVVYGKEYSGNTGVIILLALNMLVSAVTYPYSRGLFSLERAKADMLINVAAVAVLFLVGIAAVKSYGAFGAAAALFISTGITGLIRSRLFAREIRHRAPEGPPHVRQVIIESGD